MQWNENHLIKYLVLPDLLPLLSSTQPYTRVIYCGFRAADKCKVGGVLTFSYNCVLHCIHHMFAAIAFTTLNWLRSEYTTENR